MYQKTFDVIFMNDEDDSILEKPQSKQVTDLQTYLMSLKLEMNIEKYEYILDKDFVVGIRLYVKVLGIVKPVDVQFDELGFNETRLKKSQVDIIFKAK